MDKKTKKCEHMDDWGYCKLSVFYPQFVYPCNIDYCFNKSMKEIEEERSQNERKNT